MESQGEGLKYVAPEALFGVWAGRVWQALSKRNIQSVEELSRESSLTEEEVCGGLGWLAREGKLAIVEGGKRYMLLDHL